MTDQSDDESGDVSMSSSSDVDDNEAVLLTEDVEQQIARTIHAIRNNDPSVYDKNTNFAPKINFDKLKNLTKQTKDDEKRKQLLEKAEEFRIQQFFGGKV
eukprot:UN22764